MKLVDMKVTAAERKAHEKKCEVPVLAGDDYGYGLRLSLNDSELEKLGVKNLPAVGKTYTLTAKAVVISARQNRSTHGNDRGIELQIQKLSLGGGSVEDAMDEAIDEANS